MLTFLISNMKRLNFCMHYACIMSWCMHICMYYLLCGIFSGIEMIINYIRVCRAGRDTQKMYNIYNYNYTLFSYNRYNYNYFKKSNSRYNYKYRIFLVDTS